MPLFTDTSDNLVRDAINAANPSLLIPVSEANLYFGQPSLEGDGVTTSAPTTAQLGGVYEGYQTFTYKRINLTEAFETDNKPVLISVGADTLIEMLPLVNKAFGLNLTAKDVIDVNVERVEAGDQINIQVIAAPASMGYTGSFTFFFQRLYPDIDTVFPVTALTVLTQPIDPTLGKKSLALEMWGVDFTAMVSNLGVAGGSWKNLNAVILTAQEILGVSTWPAPAAGAVSDQATSAVPSANPAFDRVVIQKNVTVDNFLGDAYFHYNL